MSGNVWQRVASGGDSNDGSDHSSSAVSDSDPVGSSEGSSECSNSEDEGSFDGSSEGSSSEDKEALGEDELADSNSNAGSYVNSKGSCNSDDGDDECFDYGQ